MSRFLSVGLLSLAVLLPFPAVADDGVPPARVAIERDTDFPGSDIGHYLDTTLDACQAACIADDGCVGFTFNARNNSCFTKGAIAAAEPYAEAVSGWILRTDPTVLANAAARAADLDFLTTQDFEAAETLAREIGRHHSSNGYSADSLRAAARHSETTGDLRAAWSFTGAAIAVGDSAEDWLDYARLGLQVTTDNNPTPGERVLPALISAWLRATGPDQASEALVQMAAALEQGARGRQAIDAIRLAQTLRQGRDLDAELDRLIGMFGFKVADTQVDSDPAVPRVCVTFSEPLVQAGLDYAPYVQVPDVSFTTEVSDRQLCLDGMRHGEHVAITLRQGLPAASGETLVRNVDLDLYIRDREPQARFASRAYVLPRTPDAGLPIETVNAARLDLELAYLSDRNILRSMQEHLFASALSPWREEWFESEIAEPVWSGSMNVSGELNTDTLTRIPVAEPLADQPPGVYVLTATIPGVDPYEVQPSSQWFLLSDLGIATMLGSDGLTVDVRSLADTAAVAGAEVQLVTRANAVLGTALTDADGHAQFDAGLTRGTGAAQPALVTVTMGDDMGFLSLLDPAFDLSDRGVEGRESAGPIDVFLTTDRGIYRAGEVVHLTALMRDDRAQALSGVPLTAILTRPDGVEYTRVASVRDMAGAHVFALPIASSAQRGTWQVEVRADTDAPALASSHFLVEDFLPERIDVTLGLPDTIAADATLPVDVTARYLFGPPAPDMSVEGEVTLRAADTLPGWPGYVFGRQDEEFHPRRQNFDLARTGADGEVTLRAALPEAALTADRPLNAEVTTRVSEGSGRPVGRQENVAVTPAQVMIGLHPLFDGVLPEGADARFDVIALGSDQKPRGAEVQWSVNRLRTRYQWFMSWGSWNWDKVVTRERVASGTGTLGNTPLTVTAPVDWGQYELLVETVGPEYAASSMRFDAGWYGAGSDEDTPDMLEASLDAETYVPGDTATLRVVPRFAGTALVSVLSDRVIHLEWVEVTEGENLIPLSVTDDWGTGAYVSAMVVRPMDARAGRNPSRALGLVHAAIDPGDKALEVMIETPLDVEPRAPVTVAMDVRGVTPGEPAFVTLAAVDVGILNMTGFTSPDPAAYYFGQRRLGVELRDLYGRLIDGMTGTTGDIRSGGDAAFALAMQAPPPTEALVAFFEGPVAVDDQGRAEVTFDMPAFNGTVRLMAVAWSAHGVGQASSEIVVRDPVVVTASLPRFLAPGDNSRLLLELTHAEGPAGEMALAVEAPGLAIDPADVPASVTLAADASMRLSIPVTAKGEGIQQVRVTLTTPDGQDLSRELSVPVEINDPEISRTTRLALGPGQGFTLDAAAFDGLLPGSGVATLSIGPLARLDAAALMSTLESVTSYGSTERVASAAMPLIYFSDVAQALDLGTAEEIGGRISDAITAVLANQDSNGAFGMWSPNSGDLWLDAYATDFLSRARARGYAVSDTAWQSAIDNLRNEVNYYPEFEEGGQDLAYALLVLAREGEAAVGDLRYYADVRADFFGSALARAQIGAALAYYGDQRRADAMFARAQRILAADKFDPDTARDDYGTLRRDAAAVLTLAVEAGSTAVDRALLAARAAGTGGPVSTQEAVWSLMAAHALVDDLRVSGLRVNGAVPDMPVMRVSADEVAITPVRIANDSTAEVDLTLTTFGVSEVPPAAGGQGYSIRRAYYTMDGEPVEAARNVASGTRLVTVLTIEPLDQGPAHLLVTDPLPAGFEIDNPDVLRGGDLSTLPWLETVDPEHAEFRQDRFVAAVDLDSEGKAFRLAYIVRAVSPGTFRHPAANVEDMYRPQMRANGDSGTITVTE